MLHSYYGLLTQWLYLHPHWGGMIAFIIAFSESIALIGSIVPGSVTMTAVGIMIGTGILPLWLTLLWTVIGALLGDGFSYWLGYHFKDNIRGIWPFSRYPNVLIKGQSFVLKHGGKSIFFGRFVGPVRAIIPIVAGMFGMQYKRYFMASIPAAILWAPVYMLPGILLGTVSLEMPADIATGLILSVLVILVIIWLIMKTAYYLYQKTHHYLADLFDEKWQYWQVSPYKSWICSLLRYADRPGKRGQIILALLSIVALVFFIFLLIDLSHLGMMGPWNEKIYHLFRSIRTPMLDKSMMIITSFGNSHVVLSVALVLTLFFVIRKYYMAAIHCFMSMFLVVCTTTFLKHIFFSPRPTGIIHVATTSSFPSGHTSLAFTFYGLIAFLIGRTIKTNIRRYVYWSSIIFCTFIGISRLYLTVHWLTDVMAGALLGLICLGMTVISYRRYPSDQISRKGILWILVVSFSVVMGWHLHHSGKTELQGYQLYWQTQVIPEQTWWDQKSTVIPLYRTNRIGSPVELLNVQWLDSLQSLKKTLISYGWQEVPSSNRYITTFEKIIEQDIAKYKTLLPILYDAQPPVLEMMKFITPESPPLVLRLWPSHIHLTPYHYPLWIGTLYYDRIKKSWLFTHHKQYTLESKAYQLLTPLLTHYTWRIQSVHVQHLPKRLIKKRKENKVILIKPRYFTVKGDK